VITLNQYFNGRPHTAQQSSDAMDLLSAVNALLAHYSADEGVELPINPHTGDLISGQNEGGFRLPDCPQGALHSSHKEAKAVDVYDPNDDLDTYLNDEILTQYNLYREAPHATLGWAHMTTREPGSGHITFEP
jgi:hypothetical protein